MQVVVEKSFFFTVIKQIKDDILGDSDNLVFLSHMKLNSQL